MFRIFYTAMILSACSLPHMVYDPNASDAEMTANSVAAFKQHVQPVLQECASCHAETQAPKFMAADGNTAHAAALPKVNFDDLSKSRFLERVIIDEHNCGNDCKRLGEELRTALKKWQAARAKHTSSSGSGKETAAHLLTNSSTTEMTWSIGHLISSKYQDKVSVSVTIEPDDAAQVYHLKNMRVRADGVDVYIGTVTPLINAERQESTTFSKLNCKIPAITSDSHNFELTVMTTGTTIAPTDYSVENNLSLTFDELRIAKEQDDILCWNKDTYNAIFTTNIKPILTATCMNCHQRRRQQQPPDVAAITVLMSRKEAVLAILNGENSNHQGRQPVQDMSDVDKTSIIDFLNLTAPD